MLQSSAPETSARPGLIPLIPKVILSLLKWSPSFQQNPPRSRISRCQELSNTLHYLYRVGAENVGRLMDENGQESTIGST